MTASEIADRRNNHESGFSTAEIKSRIEAMFDARTHPTRMDKFERRDHVENEL